MTHSPKEYFVAAAQSSLKVEGLQGGPMHLTLAICIEQCQSA